MNLASPVGACRRPRTVSGEENLTRKGVSGQRWGLKEAMGRQRKRSVCELDLARAFDKVRCASGSPGVDGQAVSDFQSCLMEELNRLVTELRSKTYQPYPVRRVTIPKLGGGERHLGIPTVFRCRPVDDARVDCVGRRSVHRSAIRGRSTVLFAATAVKPR